MSKFFLYLAGMQSILVFLYNPNTFHTYSNPDYIVSRNSCLLIPYTYNIQAPIDSCWVITNTRTYRHTTHTYNIKFSGMIPTEKGEGRVQTHIYKFIYSLTMSSSSLYHIPLGAVVYCAYMTLFLSSILIPSRIPYRDIILKKGSKSILCLFVELYPFCAFILLYQTVVCMYGCCIQKYLFIC